MLLMPERHRADRRARTVCPPRAQGTAVQHEVLSDTYQLYRRVQHHLEQCQGQRWWESEA
jgi:hypothetical protein